MKAGAGECPNGTAVKEILGFWERGGVTRESHVESLCSLQRHTD
jgi:hypothetical protein